MRGLLIGFVLVLGTACMTAAKWKERFPDTVPVTTEQAEPAVRAIMLDPDSARFSNMKPVGWMTTDGFKVYALCGYVNGRNSYGGYTGRQPFIYMRDSNGRDRAAIIMGPVQRRYAPSHVESAGKYICKHWLPVTIY